MELSVLLDSPDPGAALRIAFQPIVDLDTEEVVAHEALVRGPAGSALEQPAALFAAAAATGRVPGLDWACRSAALRTALALRWEGPLFLNVEPATLGSPPPTGHEALIAAAVEELDIVLEITERSITARPADLLGAVRWARSKGWGVAVDDIGADPGSLALLPLLRPDVIKLDRGLIQRRPDAWTASVMTAVHATAERTGASVLAEGIETEDHLRAGHGLGADLGQGFHFGRPEGSPRAVTAPWTVRSPVVELPMGATPYEVIARHSHVRQATKPMLVAISKHLESEAAGLSSPGVLLSAFQDRAHVTPATVRRYERLADRCVLVAALGMGLSTEPMAGVRGARLETSDPLVGEWSVLVVGAHFAGALVACDLGDSGPEAGRRFDYVLTHDRDLVLAGAQTLLERIAPT